MMLSFAESRNIDVPKVVPQVQSRVSHEHVIFQTSSGASEGVCMVNLPAPIQVHHKGTELLVISQAGLETLATVIKELGVP